MRISFRNAQVVEIDVCRLFANNFFQVVKERIPNTTFVQLHVFDCFLTVRAWACCDVTQTDVFPSSQHRRCREGVQYPGSRSLIHNEEQL